jgi:5-methylcytosine-specific restriction protein A
MRRYKDPRWIRKREAILRRDEYLCRECRRYGRSVQANTVHHIYPAEDYPQWWLESWNLISLCAKCANSMHDRTTGQLTALGRQWQERISPPPQP